MKTGIYISGLGHALLILWVLFGGLFSASRHEPVEVAQVSLVSGEEYAALTAPASAPNADVTAPAPKAPEIEKSPRPKPAPEARPETPDAPAPTPPATPDAAPDVSQVAPPPPDAEVTDQAPTPPAPPSQDDGATIVTENGRPEPAPRIAPEAAPEPSPDAAVSQKVTEATRPSPDAATPVPKVEESTAPEAATTEIVTEADQQDKPDRVLTASMRPRIRPTRPEPAPTPTPEPAAQPAPAPQPTPEPAPTQDAVASAVDSALQDALGGGSQTTTGNGLAAAGPPMTSGEKDALRIAVQNCWVVDPGSPAAKVTVTVAMSMTEQGKVADGSLKLKSSEGGDDQAAQVAFDAARRAILRCERDGFDLPVEKYAQWRDIEMTFNPEKMRIK